MAMSEVYQTGLYSFLKNQTHAGGVTSFIHNNELQQVKLISDQYQKVNVWDLKHVPISIGNNQYKLDQMAEIEKRSSGNAISKFNQQYRLTVEYNFIGTEPLAKKVREDNIEELKTKLPIGYKVFEQNYDRWDKKNKKQYYFNPLCILNNTDFNIIDIPVKDKFVDVLNYSCSGYFCQDSCFISFKGFCIIPLYHKLVA